MKMFITSDFPSTGNDEVAHQIHKSMERKNPEIFVISTPCNNDLSEEIIKHLDKYNFRNVRHLNLQPDTHITLEKIIEKAEILYLLGGDPKKILDQYTEYMFVSILDKITKQDKIVISASGSSVLISKDISVMCLLYPNLSKSKKKIRSYQGGLGLFPYVTIPHFNRYNRKDKIEQIKKFSENSDKAIYSITDGSAINYTSGEIIAIGHIYMFKDGNRTSVL
jgi:peptidase E